MTRCIPMALLLVALAGCGHKSDRTAEWTAVGGIAGAASAGFRVDLALLCLWAKAEGADMERAVSGQCQEEK
jgi:hypothetical protein